VGIRLVGVGCVVFAIACSGSAAAPAHRAALQPAVAPSESAFVLAVRESCGEAGRQARDRARGAGARIQAFEHWLGESGYQAQLVPLIDECEHAIHGGAPAATAVAEVLARHGVPGVECGGLARLLVLARSGEADVDPAIAAASAAHDLESICRDFQDTSDAHVDPTSRAVALAEDLEQSVTSERVFDVFVLVANADPAQRYAILRQAARELGVPQWTCPAIEQAFRASRVR
jgi:hypothetical protein